MAQKAHMYTLSILAIIISFSLPVKANHILVVGQMSSIPYDVFLCRQKEAVDNILQAQQDMAVGLTQLTMRVYINHGICKPHTAIHIKIKEIYDTVLLNYHAKNQMLTVVHLQTSNGGLFFGAVPSDHLGIMSI